MTLYVVRHAHAGDRATWDAPDRERPLSDKGRRQAEALAGMLCEVLVDRLLSSPYRRCVETLEPLARVLGLTVEHDRALVEGAPAPAVAGLIARESDQDVVLSTHGDVIGVVCDLVAEAGVTPGETGMAKGSIWVLDMEGRAVVGARYVAPPSV